MSRWDKVGGGAFIKYAYATATSLALWKEVSEAESTLYSFEEVLISHFSACLLACMHAKIYCYFFSRVFTFFLFRNQRELVNDWGVNVIIFDSTRGLFVKLSESGCSWSSHGSYLEVRIMF
jgi:hypothetical protein